MGIVKYKVRLGLAVLLCLSFLSLEAKVKLPALISNRMVLQREQPVKIWGMANIGESVKINFLKKDYNATANSKGEWEITLPPMKAGGPYTLRVNDIELKDVLIGDVWLCSGQSNMELPVKRITDLFKEEISKYENPQIHQLKVPNTFNFHGPQNDMPKAEWKSLTQDNVMEFSAVAYFFAKALFEKTKVPVGIINSSWGGTPVEAWISEEGLKNFPMYLHDKWQYEDDDYLKEIKRLEGMSFHRWNLSLYKGDAGLHGTKHWYATDYDDSHWQNTELFSEKWATNRLNPVNGSHWFRKHIEIPEAWEGQQATLRLGCIVDADSVYVNGTFVGTTSYQYPPRIYTIPAGILKKGDNLITVRLISNSGYPHFVKDKPYKLIYGKEEISLEGIWKYQLGAAMPVAPNMTFFCYKPVCLYNAMIAPLRNYQIKGMIWYQGESNVSRRNEYAGLLTAMISDWRQTFGKSELPFYIVELADFLAPDDPGRQAWAEFRKVQAQVAQTNPYATLIHNSDLGEWNDIHPQDKKTLGNRIANKVWEDLQENNRNK